jgi:cellulose synthase/poly-beta-1,6-N-acetylglucosamine synthase-like glycosyltransferase
MVYLLLCVYAYMYVHMYVCMYVCMYTCMYVQDVLFLRNLPPVVCESLSCLGLTAV